MSCTRVSVQVASRGLEASLHLRLMSNENWINLINEHYNTNAVIKLVKIMTCSKFDHRFRIIKIYIRTTFHRVTSRK